MKDRLTRVYVAGKLNDMAVEYLYNVHKLMETAEMVRNHGFSVFVPAIDLLMGIKFGYKEYTDYFDNGQPWLMASDAVFLTPGWQTSEGTKKEVELAGELGIPVFDDIEDLIEANKDGILQRPFVDEMPEYVEGPGEDEDMDYDISTEIASHFEDILDEE